MSVFSSGKHNRLTAGTAKWVTFYRPLTNPANPILAAARATPGANIYWADLMERPTTEQIEHARSVLARLAILKGES